eukprot:c36521_g1_i1 orf=136-489(+)
MRASSWIAFASLLLLLSALASFPPSTLLGRSSPRLHLHQLRRLALPFHDEPETALRNVVGGDEEDDAMLSDGPGNLWLSASSPQETALRNVVGGDEEDDAMLSDGPGNLWLSASSPQ